MPDTELGAKLGLHRRRIALKRRELGIPNFVTRTTKNRWTPKIVAKLGKVPDQEIADEMGIKVLTVTAYRLRHGIKFYETGPRHRWTKKQLAMLGTMPDSELAEKLGILPSAVSYRRNVMGIKSYSKKS